MELAPGSAAAGMGPGWLAVARELANTVPPGEVQRLWVFAPVRKEEREFGTAVIARAVDGERIRVYTARYVRVVRGRERGQNRVLIDEVAECPLPVVYEVLARVQERVAEGEPPVEIPPATWYGDS